MEDKGILILFSVALLALSFSPTSWQFLGFIALVPLFFELHYLKEEQAPLKTYLKKGYLFGILFMGYMHIWFLSLEAWSSWASIIVLVMLYSLYLGLFYMGLFGSFYLCRHRPWISPFLWIVWEYLRSISSLGNPTGTLGYSQSKHLLFIQQASFGGIFWISFLCCTVNLLIFICIKKGLHKQLAMGAFVSLLALFLGSYGFGALQLYTPTPSTKTLEVGFIQANHPQEYKLNRAYGPQLRKDYIQLTKALLKDQSADYLIFPETITTQYNLDYPSFMTYLRILSKRHGTAFMFGSPLFKDSRYYNSLVLYDHNTDTPSAYHKQQLMPFAEYWPFKGLFRFLQLGAIIPNVEYSPGSQYNLYHDSVNIGTAVCLESLYPWFFRASTRSDADFLTVIANNAWFRASSGAYKHFNMSIFRAIENNRYLVQSANTGISAVVSNKGEILMQTELNEQVSAVETIQIGLPRSWYTRLGDWIIYLSGCLILITIIRTR